MQHDLAQDIRDLKLCFNALAEELRSLKSKIEAVESALDSFRKFAETACGFAKLEVRAAKTYAKVLSKIEARLAVDRWLSGRP